MASKTATIKAVVLGDVDNFKKGMGDAADASEGFSERSGGSFKRIGEAAAGFLTAQAIPAILGMGADLISLGGQVDTWGKKAQTVFGEQTGVMQTWADSVNESMGLSQAETLNMATSLGDLLKPLGFTAEQAANMSKEMIGSAGALSAWSGGTKTAAEVSEIMTAAMLGETDGLKSLGIAISAEEVGLKAMSMGLAESANEVDAQAAALATQALILEKSTDAQTAWSDGTMNAVKTSNNLKAQFADLKVTIAEKLTPAFQSAMAFVVGTALPAIQEFGGTLQDRVLPAVRGVAEWVGSNLLPPLKQFGQWLKDNQPVLIGVAVAIGVGLVSAFVSWAIAAGSAAVATIAATLPIIAIGAAIAALVAGVIWAYQNWGWFRDAVDAVASFLRDTLWPILKQVGEWIGGALVTHFNVAREAIGWIVDRGQDLYDLLSTYVFPVLQTVAGWIGTYFVTQFGLARTAIGFLVDAFQAVWTKAVEVHDGVTGAFEKIVGFVGGLAGRIASASSGMWDGIKNAFRSALNWVVDAWNGLNFPGISVQGIQVAPGFGTPDISRFAQGGLVKGGRGGVLGMIGEGRHDELVVPLDKAGRAGGFGTTINVTVVAPVGASSRDIGRELQRHLNEYARAS